MNYNFQYLNNSFSQLDRAWQNFLIETYHPDLHKIDQTLTNLSQSQTIYPQKELTFAALKNSPMDKTKVVILGQDPYHGESEANGLAFAVPINTPHPPSLRNIYKELALEYEITSKQISPNILESWAIQGVLLLNCSLSVIKDQANSLANIGWHTVTDGIIQKISQNNKHVVFMLWGKFAQQKIKFIDNTKHLILKSVHPSPLSAHRGFFGSNHFKLANEYLLLNNITPIKWV